jgi:lipopolysaccharide export system protein LptA
MTAARLFRGAALAAAAALALASGGAQAQIAASGDAPIDITADNLDLIDAERVQVWTGSVEAVQGTNRLRSSVLRVFHAAKPGARPGELGQWGDAQRMVAEGPVHFVTPDSIAKGDRAVYELLPDEITITGNVVVTRGENVVKGDRLVIDVKTGRSTLASNAKGRGSDRVRGVFYPGSDQRPAAGGGAGR